MKQALIGVFVGAVTVAAIFVSLAAVGQDGIVSLVRPLIVDVRQSVPVFADVIVPAEDGSIITATVPLTVDIALQVAISGVISESIRVEGEESEVLIATPVPVRNSTDDAIVRDIQWTVVRVDDRGGNLELGDEDYLKFGTTGTFYVVNLSLENVGRQPVSIGDMWTYRLSVQLVDDQGRMFAPFYVGYSIDNLCENAKLNPGLPVTCYIAYEVPKNEKLSALSVVFESDGEESEQALIEVE